MVTPNPGPYPERTNADGSADWVFVVHENARGWILDGICREIGSRQPSSWHVCYYPTPAPAAGTYFFSHYSLFDHYLRKHPDKVGGARTLVWYTHPRVETPESVAKLLDALGQATCVIFTCEANRRVWIDRGLPAHRTAVVLGGADPDLFQGHGRGGGVVGLSSSFYERKDPDRLLEVIAGQPGRRFVLLGRNWEAYARFDEMRSLGNFTYLTAPYAEYPGIYATFDVFLSVSRLEGGPIPLLEAMMANAVPVASRTGFAPDLIRHGENGYLFDVDAPAGDIAALIEAAFAHAGDVRSTVERYSWASFSAAIVDLAR